MWHIVSHDFYLREVEIQRRKTRMFDENHFVGLILEECGARTAYLGREMVMAERPVAYLVRTYTEGHVSLYDAWRHYRNYLRFIGKHLLRNNNEENAAGWHLVRHGQYCLKRARKIGWQLRKHTPPWWMFWQQPDSTALPEFEH
jgi:hypothetical protein